MMMLSLATPAFNMPSVSAMTRATPMVRMDASAAVAEEPAPPPLPAIQVH